MHDRCGHILKSVYRHTYVKYYIHVMKGLCTRVRCIYTLFYLCYVFSSGAKRYVLSVVLCSLPVLISVPVDSCSYARLRLGGRRTMADLEAVEAFEQNEPCMLAQPRSRRVRGLHVSEVRALHGIWSACISVLSECEYSMRRVSAWYVRLRD